MALAPAAAIIRDGRHRRVGGEPPHPRVQYMVQVSKLAAKHGSGFLWPEDLKERANADRWMDWCTTTVWDRLRPVFHGLIRTPENERDMKLIHYSAKETGQVLAILDSWLVDKKYICGDSFTMGDIPLGFAIYRWYALDIERPEWKNISNWYDRLCERSAYQEHIMIPLQ